MLLGKAAAARLAQVHCGIAQRSAGVLNGQAARSHRLIRTPRGGGTHHHDLIELHLQLLRDDQPQRMRNALAEIHLARIGAQAPIRPDVEPLAQARVLLQVLGKRRRVHEEAFCTARITRLCTPQRHRFPSSACRMSGPEGCGLRLRSAAAAISSPLVQ